VGLFGVARVWFKRGERRRFAMPIPLRSDFDTVALRAIARRSKDGPQARRLLALAAIYEGGTRTEAARIGGVTLQIVRDWVVKFNAHGPEGLIDRKPPGQPSRLTDAHRTALMALIDEGPIPSVHGVVRWRLVDLIAWLWEEFHVTISKQALSREVRALGYRKLSARPRHHAKSEVEVSAFKKPSPPVWRRSPRAQAASQ
jgi:transposase